MELKLQFDSIENNMPDIEGKKFIPCLCLINGNHIEYGVWIKFQKKFWSHQFSRFLNGVTHYHILKKGGKVSDNQDAGARIEELERAIRNARRELDWALEEIGDGYTIGSDGKCYLNSAEGYLSI